MKKRKLQVFVSSTFTDLKAERQAAVSAILKAGHIPAGMELFTAGDKSQLEIIKKWIDESDVYMLVLGGRYGSVEPASNVSYTELEYDYAVEVGKPVFAVVMEEAALENRVKSSGTAFLERENPKELAQFREKVRTRMCSFFSDEKDIRLCVYESLSDFSQNASLKGWVSSSDVEDTSALYEEMRVLRAENSELKEALQKAQTSTAPASTRNKDPEYKELQDVLKQIEIKVPADASGGTEFESDLLSIFFSARDSLTTGVTNQINAGDVTTFLYFNIAPKLIVHGLMANEKVAGVQWRRSFVTQKGLDFLAYYDRHRAESKERTSKKLGESNGPVTVEPEEKEGQG